MQAIIILLMLLVFGLQPRSPPDVSMPYQHHPPAQELPWQLPPELDTFSELPAKAVEQLHNFSAINTELSKDVERLHSLVSSGRVQGPPSSRLESFAMCDTDWPAAAHCAETAAHFTFQQRRKHPSLVLSCCSLTSGCYQTLTQPDVSHVVRLSKYWDSI